MIKFNRPFSAFMLCFVLFLCGMDNSDQADVDSEEMGQFKADEVTDLLEETMRCKLNPALTVIIVKNGQVIYSHGFGVRDLENKEPVNNQTVFCIGSLSKAFAATLLVKFLHEKTNFTVDSKVKDFLGDQFKMPDEFRTSETTFADLMAHRTAVPSNNRIRFDGNLTRDTLLDRLHKLPAPAPFRVKFYYSNLMYGLVTHMTELLGGKRWEELIKENLFDPLGMSRSMFTSTFSPDTDNVVVPYVEKNGEFLALPPGQSRKWAELGGSGSVMSSAEDMAKWMNFHLSAGQNEAGRQVVKAEYLAQVHKARFLIGSYSGLHKPKYPVSNTASVYAHGFRVGAYRGLRQLAHSGSTQGFAAYLSLLPDQNIGVFTGLTSGDPDFRYRKALHAYLLDQALGLKPWLNASTVCSYPEPWRKIKPPRVPVLNTSIPLQYAKEKYLGTFHNDAFGFLHIHFNDTTGTLEMIYGWGSWHLYPQPTTKDEYEEIFFAEGFGTAFAFDLSKISFMADAKEEKIKSVKGISFESRMPPIFKRVGEEPSMANNVQSQLLALGLIVLLVVCTRLF